MQANLMEKFPIRYDVHKYLGRKPWYILEDIIKKYTQPGDTILDLFSGSGVASFEALRLGRNVVAIDCSPLSELIVRALCEGCDVIQYQSAAKEIVSRLKELEGIYRVKIGSKTGTLKYWMPNLSTGKLLFSDGSEYSGVVKDAHFLKNDELESFSWQHEADRIPVMDGSIVSTWGEVFPKRAQSVLYYTFSSIMRIDAPAVRRCLLVTLSASVEKVCSLNHFKSGKKGWMRDRQTCYYKHHDFIEFNAVEALTNKITKMGSALVEVKGLLADRTGKFTFIRSHVEGLRHANAANLVIMDPPYLSEVQYDQLEALHAIWLGFKPPKHDIRVGFRRTVSYSGRSLTAEGNLVLLMLNYLADSKAFFVDTLTQNGFMKIYESEDKGRKKEGLSITVFRKGM